MMHIIIDIHRLFDHVCGQFFTLARYLKYALYATIDAQYYFLFYLKKYFLQDWFWGKIFKGRFLKNMNFIVLRLLTRSFIFTYDSFMFEKRWIQGQTTPRDKITLPCAFLSRQPATGNGKNVLCNTLLLDNKEEEAYWKDFNKLK